jgi:hypothetical protein
MLLPAAVVAAAAVLVHDEMRRHAPLKMARTTPTLLESDLLHTIHHHSFIYVLSTITSPYSLHSKYPRR